MLRKSLRSIVLAVITALSPTPLLAESIPHVYSHGGVVSANSRECARVAKRFARESGFIHSLEVVFDQSPEQGANIYAVNRYKNARFFMRCDVDYGIYSYSVGHNDMDIAWDIFDILVSNDPGEI